MLDEQCYINLENVCYSVLSFPILQEISLQISAGQFVLLIGKNGSGKSTLCRLIAGILKPSSGIIKKKNNLNITYIPQSYTLNNLVGITVKKFIQLGNKNHLSSKRAKGIIEALEIDNLLANNLHNLSGGELQRIMIARALVNEPEIVIMDEALAMISYSLTKRIYEILNDIKYDNKMSIILVSHSPEIIKNNENYICILKDSKFCYQGNLKNITHDKIASNFLRESFGNII